MRYLLLVVLMLPTVVLANPYTQKCAMCHGAAGISAMSHIPNLADTKLSAEQIIEVIDNGRGKMPKISLDDAQKSEVVQYIVSSIKK
jgi:mono/diheme cytochrome c family protein